MTKATPVYTVQLDEEKCSLCEVCARDCPTGALETRKTEDVLALIFKPGLCDGCPDTESCQQTCPEQAIVVAEGEAPPEEVVLVQGKMIACTYCNAQFAPTNKLDAVERKAQEDVVRDLCPLCRREQLVVKFVEETRVPGSKAEYRSTKDILRKAGHHPRAIRK